MCLGEGALARKGGHYWDVGEFGELDEFGCRLGIEDALPDIDDGRARAKQRSNDIAHIFRGCAGLVDFDRLVVQLAGELGSGDIAGELQQHGA